MLSSMLSSTIFMMGTGSLLGSGILLMYLFMHEIIPSEKSKGDMKAIFMPTLSALTIIFLFTIIIKIMEILK